MTAHRSQGQSVDAVVIAGETMSRELFYVAASRGREQLTVITSDKARLEESVGRSGARLSASELVRTMHASVGGRPRSRMRREASNGASERWWRGRASRWDSSRIPMGMRVPAPVQQQAIAHAAGHEPGGPAQQLERGQGHGISR